MSTIAIRRGAWLSASLVQRRVLLHTMEALGMGDADEGIPPVYRNPSGVLFFVWDDDRITLRDLAILGTVAAKLAGVDDSMLPITKEKVRNYVKANAVWPSEIDYLDEANPWQRTLTEQGAPAWVVAGPGIPEGWAPQNV